MLHSGYESTWAVGWYEGWPIRHSFSSSPIGGRHVTEAVLASLQKGGELEGVHPDEALLVAQQVKEKFGTCLKPGDSIDTTIPYLPVRSYSGKHTTPATLF